MICAIYRSVKKVGAYLYITKKDDFSDLPDELLQIFGKPEFAMLLNLANKEELANADINKVKQALEGDGYYLQMPPRPDQILAKIKTQNTKLMIQQAKG